MVAEPTRIPTPGSLTFPIPSSGPMRWNTQVLHIIGKWLDSLRISSFWEVHCVCGPWQFIQIIFPLSEYFNTYLQTSKWLKFILVGHFKMIKSIFCSNSIRNSFHTTIRETYWLKRKMMKLPIQYFKKIVIFLLFFHHIFPMGWILLPT